jgi:hypothetical protein
MPFDYDEKRFFGRHYDWPEWAHQNAVKERDRRAAAIKTKRMKPPNKIKGPGSHCNGAETQKITPATEIIDCINTGKNERAQARTLGGGER